MARARVLALLRAAARPPLLALSLSALPAATNLPTDKDCANADVVLLLQETSPQSSANAPDPWLVANTAEKSRSARSGLPAPASFGLLRCPPANPHRCQRTLGAGARREALRPYPWRLA